MTERVEYRYVFFVGGSSPHRYKIYARFTL